MFKSKTPEKEKKAMANAAGGTPAQPPRSLVALDAASLESRTKAGTVSYIGSGMSIIGNIECDGAAQVFGQVKGELRASDLLIGEGAQVEGTVIAQEVTVCGRMKGSIRAVRVELQAGGVVEGDIFHCSLSIDQNSLFEGSSRRVENPTKLSSSIDAKVQEKQDLQSSAPPPLRFNGDLPAALKNGP